MILFVLWAIALLAAGAWDLWVLRYSKFDSGETASWLIYSDSRKWPAIAFLTGWFAPRPTTWQEWVGALVLFVAGHIFGTMRGAK